MTAPLVTMTPVPSWSIIGERWEFRTKWLNGKWTYPASHAHFLTKIEGKTGHFKTIIRPSRGWARRVRRIKAGRRK